MNVVVSNISSYRLEILVSPIKKKKKIKTKNLIPFEI